MTGAEGLEHIAARIGDASVSGVGTDMNKDSETVKLMVTSLQWLLLLNKLYRMCHKHSDVLITLARCDDDDGHV